MKKVLFIKGGSQFSLENKVNDNFTNLFGSINFESVSYEKDCAEALKNADFVVLDFCLANCVDLIQKAVSALNLYAKVTVNNDFENSPIVVEGVSRQIFSTASSGKNGRDVIDEERISFVEIEKILRTGFNLAEKCSRNVLDKVNRSNLFDFKLVVDQKYGIDKAYISVLSEIVAEYKDIKVDTLTFDKYLQGNRSGIVVSPKFSTTIWELEDGDDYQVECYLGRDNRCLIVPKTYPPYFFEDLEKYQKCVDVATEFLRENF